jgi:hypothetical protein
MVDELALNGIPVDVVELLLQFLAAPDVKIVKAALPEGLRAFSGGQACGRCFLPRLELAGN